MEMNVSKKEKVKAVEELHKMFEKAGAVILTDYKGMTVAQLTDLRIRLRKCGAEYRVIKNTLAVRASEGTGVKKVDDHFTGTTGVVLGYEDLAGTAKVVYEVSSKIEPFKLRVGVFEGIVLDAARIKEVANMPPREVLLSMALGSVKSPLYGLAYTLQGIMSKLAYALSAVKDTKNN